MKRLFDTRPLALATLALALLVAGCTGADGAEDTATTNEASATTTTAPAARSVRVETLTLQPTNFQNIIELTGSVEAQDDATLSAQSAGTLTSLTALGTSVRAGQLVAQIDPKLINAAVQQAEAAVEVAQAQFDLADDNLKRQEPLYRDSIISAIEYENARAQFNQARATLSQNRALLTQAQEQLANTRITAPFAGKVEQHFVERGEQMTPGLPVVRIVNTNRVKVNVGVPERFAADISEGTPVEVSFAAYRGARRPGTITFVGSVINPNNRTFPIELELENTDGLLKPEMVADVFVTREQLSDVVVVPQSSIVRDETGNSVFVVNSQSGQNIAERRSVRLGGSYEGRSVVSEGLQTGDEVIILGQSNVTTGDQVEVVRSYDRITLAQAALAGTLSDAN